MWARSNVAAVTLIELLVVLTIIVLLSGILLSTIWHSRETASGVNCLSQMRQIATTIAIPGDEPLIYAEPDEIILLCPEGPQDGATNYGFNEYLAKEVELVDNRWVVTYRTIYTKDPSKVVVLYESKRAGTALTGDASDVDMRHNGGSNFVFADGHAKWMREVPPFVPPPIPERRQQDVAYQQSCW